MNVSRRSLIGGLAGLAAVSGLSACGGSSRDGGSSSTTAASGGSAGGGAGFAADSTIGISLPWLGTQNWKEAQDMFNTQLKAAGFDVVVQSAENAAPTQQQQISAMIQQGVKAIVVGPVDGKQLGDVLGQAKTAGIKVIGYDRLIENTDACDAVVQFGSVKTGELQGQSLLDGLKARKGAGPWNIELFGGSPTDPNAPNFFKGAMNILQPKIDDGTLKVQSGQKEFSKCSTADWNAAKAQSRMDTLYQGKKIDGVLSPNDGIARAIITSAEQAGQDIPVVSGLDAENESISWIAQGKQYSTVAKPTEDLVSKTVELIVAAQKGEELPAPDATEDNGATDVAIYQLDPIVVTKDNLKDVFANDAERMKLIEAAEG